MMIKMLLRRLFVKGWKIKVQSYGKVIFEEFYIHKMKFIHPGPIFNDMLIWYIMICYSAIMFISRLGISWYITNFVWYIMICHKFQVIYHDMSQISSDISWYVIHLKWHIMIYHSKILRYHTTIYHDILRRYIVIYYDDISWYIAMIYHDILWRYIMICQNDQE